MIKLNPVNRLRPVELGMPKGVTERFDTVVKNADDTLNSLSKKYANQRTIDSDDIAAELGEVIYNL